MTIVDFYLGAYGPTVRIDADETLAIESLVHAFDRLSSQVGFSVDLRLLPGFTFTESINGLLLMSVLSPVRKKVVRTTHDKDRPMFEMRGTRDDWMDARDLTMPLMNGKPSHQYLSAVPPDDAILEVAIIEPRPAWIRGLGLGSKP